MYIQHLCIHINRYLLAETVKALGHKTTNNFWTIDNAVNLSTIGNSVSIAKTSWVLSFFFLFFFSQGERKIRFSSTPVNPVMP